MSNWRPTHDDLFGWMNSDPSRALFRSKLDFSSYDTKAVIPDINWFRRCGERPELNLSMPVRRAASWKQAVQLCSELKWQNAELEAQNQLSLFVSQNFPNRFRGWNDLVVERKLQVTEPLEQAHIRPYLKQHQLPDAVLHCVQWDIGGALMERAYADTDHASYFFHELLCVYQSGHFPCGWAGTWPQGALFVF